MWTNKTVGGVVLGVLLATGVLGAQTWRVNTDWATAYRPDAPFEVGKMYSHPYSGQIYILGETTTLGGKRLWIVQVIQSGGLPICPGVASKVCGWGETTDPRGVWMEMLYEDGEER